MSLSQGQGLYIIYRPWLSLQLAKRARPIRGLLWDLGRQVGLFLSSDWPEMIWSPCHMEKAGIKGRSQIREIHDAKCRNMSLVCEVSYHLSLPPLQSSGLGQSTVSFAVCPITPLPCSNRATLSSWSSQPRALINVPR